MTVAHLDTSAAARLLIEEPESEALAAGLPEGRRLVGLWLLTSNSATPRPTSGSIEAGAVRCSTRSI